METGSSSPSRLAPTPLPGRQPMLRSSRAPRPYIWLSSPAPSSLRRKDATTGAGAAAGAPFGGSFSAASASASTSTSIPSASLGFSPFSGTVLSCASPSSATFGADPFARFCSGKSAAGSCSVAERSEQSGRSTAPTASDLAKTTFLIRLCDLDLEEGRMSRGGRWTCGPDLTSNLVPTGCRTSRGGGGGLLGKPLSTSSCSP